MIQVKATGRKKRTRYYETYISKLLKQISPDNGITSNSKQQLNSTLCNITRLISDKVTELTGIARKKTISEKEIINAINILFSPDLAKSMIGMCNQALENYAVEEFEKGSTRQERAGIIFPPSVAEKHIRNFGASKIMVSNAAPVALAAAMECLAGEILENGSLSAKQKKRVRITIRDLEIGIRTDDEISKFFDEHKIEFLGGGVIPYIHPNLLVKKARRQNINKVKKTHRYRPGTVSVREIRRFQKTSNCLTLAKFPFEKYTRDILQKLEVESEQPLKVSRDVFTSLQHFVEQQIVSLLKKSGLMAIHAGRVKLLASDIDIVRTILNGSSKIETHSQPLSSSDYIIPEFHVWKEIHILNNNVDLKVSAQ